MGLTWSCIDIFKKPSPIGKERYHFIESEDLNMSNVSLNSGKSKGGILKRNYQSFPTRSWNAFNL